MAILIDMESGPHLQLEDRLTEEFIAHFFGYGSWAAPIWFVGMEEGGGSSIAEISRRMTVWKERGARELEDLAEYHHEIGITRHLGPNASLQPTWAKLVRVLLAARREPTTPETVRRYQSERLGRQSGDSCLIELLPLPAPGIHDWLYGEATTLPYLATRRDYRSHVVNGRIAAIVQAVKLHRPEVVVFVGMTYSRYWNQIVKGVADPAAGVMDSPQFITIKHPASRGTTKEYFNGVGESIASVLER